MNPLVSIAVNGYRNPELLKLCLDAIRREMALVPIPYELIVADSATEEATETLMREDFPDVTFLPFRDNVGFLKLVNASLAVAKGTFVFLINSDIVLTEKTVPALVSFLEKHPVVGMVSPRQLNFNGTPQNSCFRFYQLRTILYRRTFLGKLPFGRRHLDWFTMKGMESDAARPVDWVMGSAMCVRASAAAAVGPMDDRFFMYMEDVDWCRRFWENGFPVVYVPEAEVYHYHAKGSARGGFLRSLLFNRLTWYHIESAFKYFLKYFRKPLPTVPESLEGSKY